MNPMEGDQMNIDPNTYVHIIREAMRRFIQEKYGVELTPALFQDFLRHAKDVEREGMEGRYPLMSVYAENDTLYIKNELKRIRVSIADFDVEGAAAVKAAMTSDEAAVAGQAAMMSDEAAVAGQAAMTSASDEKTQEEQGDAVQQYLAYLKTRKE